jgi:hypothetical protein
MFRVEHFNLWHRESGLPSRLVRLKHGLSADWWGVVRGTFDYNMRATDPLFRVEHFRSVAN